MNYATIWAVYPHCENGRATGRGFVARELGSDPRNYGGVLAIRVYGRRFHAERAAKRLTKPKVQP